MGVRRTGSHEGRKGDTKGTKLFQKDLTGLINL